MKIRIAFLVMMMAPLVYYGLIQLAPAGRAATVSGPFRGLGKTALEKIKAAQDAEGESDDVFNNRVAEADRALQTTNTAAVSAADRRDYTRLVVYLQSVKQDRALTQASGNPGTEEDHAQMNATREGAERTFQ